MKKILKIIFHFSFSCLISFMILNHAFGKDFNSNIGWGLIILMNVSLLILFMFDYQVMEKYQIKRKLLKYIILYIICISLILYLFKWYLLQINIIVF